METSSSNTKQRLKLIVTGVVQGVGFRPFIYQLALEHSLTGYVLNNGSGVITEIEGSQSSCESFINDLTEKKPPLSRIDSVDIEDMKLQETKEFSIIASDNTQKNTMVSPDISMCDDCREEMFDPANRRYLYPFINCTNCGPRYTIIDSLPYDRKNTSMLEFEMCDACHAEYTDPLNRRFHAQPVSCYDCGPKLSGDIDTLVRAIQDGKTVALKGIGGFHIICDATNEKAVERLRLNKNRPTKPFAVLFENIQSIKEIAELSQSDEELILSKERPIVIVTKKKESSLASSIAPNIDRVGVFLPYTPLHELLLKEVKKPLVATSANLSDEPIIREEEELLLKLSHVIDEVLSHDRAIINACDDSVMFSVHDQNIMMRLSRGYAPKSFANPLAKGKKILALGAHQKSTITFAFDEHIILSPHIGDLNTLDAFEYFLRTLETFKRFYDFEPDVIVCDKHPNYESSKWARAYVEQNPDIELLEVQHHYAHALACMAEYEINEEALAFCFDGTGYGDDHTLWGGEVFKVTPQSYERLYHLQNFSLLGGEKAIKEPKRVALSLLFECFTLEEMKELDYDLLKAFSEQEIKNFHLMYSKGLNAPKSSSIGRLFDAVYALSGNIQNASYDGESGLALEGMAKEYPSDAKYTFTIENGIIEHREIFLKMLNEKEKHLIASKFINTLVDIIITIAKEYPELPVILSGGVFQNKTLLEKSIDAFKAKNIQFYIQSQTPINDGGISFGQAFYVLNNIES